MIHNLIKDGIPLFNGDSEKSLLRFLSYSNSQLKRHSAWFLLGSEPSESSIMASMGDFSKETNILKKYARRG